jgi:hypothetical protein
MQSAQLGCTRSRPGSLGAACRRRAPQHLRQQLDSAQAVPSARGRSNRTKAPPLVTVPQAGSYAALAPVTAGSPLDSYRVTAHNPVTVDSHKRPNDLDNVKRPSPGKEAIKA